MHLVKVSLLFVALSTIPLVGAPPATFSGVGFVSVSQLFGTDYLVTVRLLFFMVCFFHFLYYCTRKYLFLFYLDFYPPVTGGSSRGEYLLDDESNTIAQNCCHKISIVLSKIIRPAKTIKNL